MTRAATRCLGSGGYPLRQNYMGGGLWRCGYCGKGVTATMNGKLYAHKKPARPAVEGGPA